MKRTGRAAWAGVATLCAGLLLAAVGAAWQDRLNHEHAEAAFGALAQRVAADVSARMGIYEYGLRGARGAVVGAETGGRLGREGFRRYSATRDIDREFRGARGFGVIWRVPQAEEAAFVERARRDGWPDFSVRQLVPHGGERYIAEFVEPVERNRAAVGVDVASEVNRRDAALASMRSGKATLTGPITLVQASGKPLRSFLLLLPIYRPDATLASVAEREAAAIGWSFAPLVIDDVLHALDSDATPHYRLTLRDQAGADTKVFYGAADIMAGAAPDLPQRRLDLPIHGRVWEAELHATPAFVHSLALTSPEKVALVVALIGALCGVLVTLLLNLLARTRSEHIEQARRAAIVATSDDAIIGATLDGVITDWNGGAERLFGHPAAQALGRRVGELLVPGDRSTEEVEILKAVRHGRRVPVFDTLRRHRDGTLIDVSVTAVPILTAAGRCVGMAKTLRDTRAARAAQRALAALNASLEQQVADRTARLDTAMHDLRQILDAVPSMIGYWDAQLVNRVANHAYAAWFGLTPDEMVGKSLPAVMSAVLFKRSRPHIEAALRGKPQRYERTTARPDGQRDEHSLVHYLPDVVAGEVRGFYVLVHDVTDLVEGRQQLAAAQRATEALLRTVHQHAIVTIADRNGRITEVNDAFCAISGYARKELIGQDHRIINSGEHPKAFWAGMWRTVAQGKAWRSEVCNRAKDGTLYWVDSIIAPFVDAQGQVEQVISIRFDITAAKQTEQRLRSSEAFLDRAGRIAGVGNWELDLRTDTVHWSAQTRRIHEVEPDYQPTLTAAIDFFAPRARADIQRAVEAATRDGAGWDLELPLITARGRSIWVRSVGTAEFDGERAVRLIGAMQDVTERVRADLERRATMTLLNTVLESATQASIIAVKPDGLVTVFNSGAQQMLGYHADEVVGKRNFLEFHDPSELRTRAASLSEQFGHQVYAARVLIEPCQLGRTQDWTYRRKDGSVLPVSLAMTAMRDAGGELFGYLGIAHDVSQQKMHERKLLHAVEEARTASLAKSQFLANMSHEIRTPMNAVIGLSYLLERSVLDVEQTATLRSINVASRALLGIINNVLDVSKIEAGEVRIERVPFSPAVVARELAQLMTLQAHEKGIAFELDLPESLPAWVEGDVTRLQQVLSNLLSNAIKFTERGRVRLQVSQDIDSEAPSDKRSVRLRFACRDSGIGISPDALARLFTPFVQADETTTRRFGGTGLGLSIVKQLVTLMGGEVGARSEPGVGSEFWAELPFSICAASDRAAGSSGLALTAGPALRGVRVLVTDDSPINLQVAQRILELEGARVYVASDGQQAVEFLRAQPAAVDIVLMDVQMPVLDGLDATRCIREELGLTTLPVVALTAGQSGFERQRIQAAGMNDLIGKPFDPPALLRCIRSYVKVADDAAPAAGTLPTDPQTDWPQIEGIDASDAAARLGGDTTLFCSLLRRLLREFDDLADVAVTTQALPTLALRLHNLKGSAGTLGAKSLERSAALAETACRAAAATAQLVAPLMRRVAAELEALERAVQPALQAAAQQQQQQRQAAEGEAEQAAAAPDVQALDALLAQLARFDLEALQSFKALATPLRPLMDDEAFQALSQNIDNLQFAEAASILQTFVAAQAETAA